MASVVVCSCVANEYFVLPTNSNHSVCASKVSSFCLPEVTGLFKGLQRSALG